MHAVWTFLDAVAAAPFAEPFITAPVYVRLYSEDGEAVRYAKLLSNCAEALSDVTDWDGVIRPGIAFLSSPASCRVIANSIRAMPGRGFVFCAETYYRAHVVLDTCATCTGPRDQASGRYIGKSARIYS